MQNKKDLVEAGIILAKDVFYGLMNKASTESEKHALRFMISVAACRLLVNEATEKEDGKEWLEQSFKLMLEDYEDLTSPKPDQVSP